MADRIRTTHVGSLPRPPELVKLLQRQEQRDDALDPSELDAAISAAVNAAVDRQHRIGIDIVNDGEMSKMSYATYVAQRYGGLSPRPTRAISFADEMERFPTWAKQATELLEQHTIGSFECDGPLTVKDAEPLKADLRRLRAAADRAGATEVFMNSGSPGIVAGYIPSTYYKTREDYLGALVEVLRPEYEAIVEAGFLLQLDCPDLSGSAVADEAAWNAERMQAIEAINAATARIDPQRMRLHLCWGNLQAPHDRDLPLSSVLPLACRARPAAISFEAANPRHEHEWTFFDEFTLPEDKTIMPGVIDNTSSFIEHPELVAQRIGHFVSKLGADRVIAGVDCGFATWATWVYDSELAYAKMESLVQGAAIAARRA